MRVEIRVGIATLKVGDELADGGTITNINEIGGGYIEVVTEGQVCLLCKRLSICVIREKS